MHPDPRIMSFGEHLEELRTRLIWSLVGLVIIFTVCLIFGGDLLAFIVQPLTEQLRRAGQPEAMLATSPLEPFGAYLKVATVVAVLLAMPWFIWQTWLFIAPGLYPSERRFACFLIPSSALLTTVGMVFLYSVLLPISLYFLISFGAGLMPQHTSTAPLPPGVTLQSVPILDADPADAPPGSMWINRPLHQLRIAFSDAPGRAGVLGMPLSAGSIIRQEYRIGEYVSLVFWLGIIFAIVFQLPLVLMLLSWVDLLRPGDVTPYRRHVLLACAVAAAAITPTGDPWTMTILGSVMYLLFELGIILMKFVPARRVAAGLAAEQTRQADSETRSSGEEGASA